MPIIQQGREQEFNKCLFNEWIESLYRDAIFQYCCLTGWLHVLPVRQPEI